jgi:uncharacterized protein (TIGR03083 family)
MTIDFLAHLRAESARFGDVLADADPSAPVPTCPDWTAADLLYHLAEVQHSWATIVRERLSEPDGVTEPERPADYQDVLTLFRQQSQSLIDALGQSADDVTVWTWLPGDQSVGFVRRRQAHEALIHRIDAELTAGVPVSEVDRALATDGVAEVLDWMYRPVPSWATSNDGPVGRLVTTDTGAEWLTRVGRWSGHSPNSGKDYTDEPTLRLVASGDPSFTVSGAARDLDAWLWNRPTVADVVIEGDASAFEAAIRSGVQ